MRRIGTRVVIGMLLIINWTPIQADILWEYWLGIGSGNSVSDLTSNPNYPDNPSGSEELAIFEAPTDWNDEYGGRIRGYLTAPATGSYVFWIASDDHSELWLSTTVDPDDSVKIASVDDWTPSRIWTTYPSQKSAPIDLKAGDKYYVEALYKEGTGGDNLAVGWAKPGQNSSAPSEVIPGTVLSPWMGGDPFYNSKPSITIPADRSFIEAPVTLQLTATAKDDGKPLPADPINPDPADAHKLRWSWSVVSQPSASGGVVWSGNPVNGEAFTFEGSSNPPDTVFTCDPTVTLDVPGVYVLKFTASDGEKENAKQMSVYIKSTGDYRKLGYKYLSPVPDAEYVPAQTRYFLVRFQSVLPQEISNLSSMIQVTGSVSGSHPGQTKIAGDGKTVLFDTTKSFTNGERVTVTLSPVLTPGTSGTVESYQYQFRIQGPMTDNPPVSSVLDSPSIPLPPASLTPEIPIATGSETMVPPPAVIREPRIMPNGVAVPSDFPHILITTNDNPDPELIFLDNRGGGGKPYNVIFDNAGSPVWYQRMPDERRDMKVQHNGVLTMVARTGGMRFVGLDNHYREIASYWAVNGYGTDEHELQVLANGHYLLIGVASCTVDMSRYVVGGNPSASVGETVIQEFTPAGELIFQWRAWDNFDVRDVHLDNIRGGSFRFPHMNALDIDDDGNILLSSRHISEITKINRETGEIIWRLSGIPKNNYFTFVNDPLIGTRNQHAIRHTGNNRYLMFDNGDLHSPSRSRGVEYELDLVNKTATVVWQYPETPTSSIYSHYMGNTQRLSNGNTLINWAVGGLPKLTEIRADGTKSFEMNWVDRWEAYRVWRCAWEGKALKPQLILEMLPDSLAILCNQFGDPEVAYYRIYAGTSPQPTSILATSTTTLKRLSNLENGKRYYVRVTSVDSHGNESDYSNEESIVVNILIPGQNMIQNGDFSQGTGSWTWSVGGTALAQWKIENGVSLFDITAGGGTVTDIQLRQTGLGLMQGKTYAFEFDAWSQQPRILEAKVEKNASPWTNYGKIGYTYITPQKKRYRYVFTMQDPSESDARVVLNLGTSPHDVYMDNVSFMAVIPGDFDYDSQVRLEDFGVLSGDWFKEQTKLFTDLDQSGKVDIGDLLIFVESWLKAPPPVAMTLIHESQPKRVWVPTGDIGYNWIGNAEPFDDSGWDLIGSNNGALDFDGADDFIGIGATASQMGIAANQPKSVAAWVYTRAFNDGGVFDLGSYEEGRNFSLRTLTVNNNWRVQFWGGSYDIDFSYDSLNQWVHFALVHTGSQTLVYANGVPVANGPRTLNTSDTNGLRIGIWRDSLFNGILDDVQLFNLSLEQADVQSIMNQGTCSKTPISRWKLDEMMGSVAYDSISTRSGTIAGSAAWVSRISGPFGVGFENNPGDDVNYSDLIGLDVKSRMHSKIASCYLRIPFMLTDDPAKLKSLTLKIRYDDGFVAFINGKEMTRDRFNGIIPDWNDDADGTHNDSEARVFQSFTVNRSEKPDLFNSLKTGNNILAIHGMNDTTTSSDFLISAELLATQ